MVLNYSILFVFFFGFFTSLFMRNITGIILIDFIDMDSDEERCVVAEALKESLEADRRKTVVHGWTKLGIIEMTRKRTGAEWEKAR